MLSTAQKHKMKHGMKARLRNPQPNEAAVLYHSMYELPFSKFVTAWVESDLTVLIKRPGKVTEEEIKQAWQKITDEYREALTTRSDKLTKMTVENIARLETQINAVDTCLLRLAWAYSEEIVQELKKWTYVAEALDPSDPEQYKKDLVQINSRQGRLQVELRMLTNDLNSDAAQTAAAKPDYAYFSDLLTLIMQENKIHLNRETLLVGEFVSFLVRIMERNEQHRSGNRKQND
jgi:hypothetical protein